MINDNGESGNVEPLRYCFARESYINMRKMFYARARVKDRTGDNGGRASCKFRAARRTMGNARLTGWKGASRDLCNFRNAIVRVKTTRSCTRPTTSHGRSNAQLVIVSFSRAIFFNICSSRASSPSVRITKLWLFIRTGFPVTRPSPTRAIRTDRLRTTYADLRCQTIQTGQIQTFQSETVRLCFLTDMSCEYPPPVIKMFTVACARSF